MNCEEIKEILPRYFQHTASEEEIQKVEEHLCVCHDCRVTLGELMDRLSDAKESSDSSAKEETKVNLPESAENLTDKDKESSEAKTSGGDESKSRNDMEYFPGKTLEDSKNFLKEHEPALPPESTPESSLEEIKGITEEEKTNSLFKSRKPRPFDLEKEKQPSEEEKTSESEEKPAYQEPEVPGDTEKIQKEEKEEIPTEESKAEEEKTPANLAEEIPVSVPEEKKEPLTEDDTAEYSLDKYPLKKPSPSIFEYICGIIGIIIFIVLLFLFLKG